MKMRRALSVLLLVALATAFAVVFLDSKAPPICLRSRTIDPNVEPSRVDGFTSGAWIIQSPRAITGEWRSSLESAGAKIHGYLPENAYLILADAEALQRIAKDVPHSYLGPYLPSDKRVASGGEPDREFLVVVFDESKRAEIAGTIMLQIVSEKVRSPEAKKRSERLYRISRNCPIDIERVSR